MCVYPTGLIAGHVVFSCTATALEGLDGLNHASCVTIHLRHSPDVNSQSLLDHGFGETIRLGEAARDISRLQWQPWQGLWVVNLPRERKQFGLGEPDL